MEEKWITDIRNKMADYRATLPDGLLEKAKQEASLRKRQAAKGKRKALIVPLWSKMAAAAVVIALCCVSAWLFLHEDSAQTPLAVNRSMEKALTMPPKLSLMRGEQAWKNPPGISIHANLTPLK